MYWNEPPLPPDPFTDPMGATPTEPIVRLELVTLFTLDAVCDLQPAEEQTHYLPPVLHSIAQSKFQDADPYCIFARQELVGFLMLARFSGIHWLTRIMIDERYQGNGYGTRALELAIDIVKRQKNALALRTSFSRDNVLAEYLFFKAGFERLPDTDPAERLMELRWD
jgi:diamine N-acetyltransferase